MCLIKDNQLTYHERFTLLSVSKANHLYMEGNGTILGLYLNPLLSIADGILWRPAKNLPFKHSATIFRGNMLDIISIAPYDSWRKELEMHWLGGHVKWRKIK